MMIHQPDYMLAQLILEYLQSEDSIEAGVPDEETLPKWMMDSGKKKVTPALIVAAKEDGSKGAMRKIIVCPMICTWLKSDEAGAAAVDEQTTREQASQWMRQVDQRVRDYEAFGAWLSALPEERRQGWTLLGLPRNGGDFPPLYDKSTAAVTYGLTQTWTILCGR